MDRPSITHLVDRRSHLGVAGLMEAAADAQRGAGHQVQTVALRPSGARGLSSGSVLGMRFRLDPFAVLRLRRHLVHSKPSILHVWDVQSLRVAAAACRVCARPPAVVACMLDPLGRSRLPKWSMRVARAVVVGDQTDHQRCVEYGLPPASIHVAPPAFLLPPEADTATDLRADLQVPVGAPVLAVAAPLERDSSIDESIWSFELLRVLHPEAVLVVCGEGREKNRLERYATLVSHGETNAVHFVGSHLLASVLQMATVFWDHSLDERLPAELLTAMAARVPVVATAGRRKRALIQDGKTGFLVSAGDRAGFGKITDKLLIDNQQLQQTTDAAAQAVATFTAGAFAVFCGEVYRQAATTPD